MLVALRCFTDGELSWQHAKFGYHGNRDGLGSCLNDTITLLDPYNPHIHTRIWHLSGRVIANFISK